MCLSSVCLSSVCVPSVCVSFVCLPVVSSNSEFLCSSPQVSDKMHKEIEEWRARPRLPKVMLQRLYVKLWDEVLRKAPMPQELSNANADPQVAATQVATTQVVGPPLSRPSDWAQSVAEKAPKWAYPVDGTISNLIIIVKQDVHLLRGGVDEDIVMLSGPALGNQNAYRCGSRLPAGAYEDEGESEGESESKGEDGQVSLLPLSPPLAPFLPLAPFPSPCTLSPSFDTL